MRRGVIDGTLREAQAAFGDGTLYIDPFQPGDLDHYIAYRKRDHDSSHTAMMVADIIRQRNEEDNRREAGTSQYRKKSGR